MLQNESLFFVFIKYSNFSEFKPNFYFPSILGHKKSYLYNYGSYNRYSHPVIIDQGGSTQGMNSELLQKTDNRKKVKQQEGHIANTNTEETRNTQENA